MWSRWIFTRLLPSWARFLSPNPGFEQTLSRGQELRGQANLLEYKYRWVFSVLDMRIRSLYCVVTFWLQLYLRHFRRRTLRWLNKITDLLSAMSKSDKRTRNFCHFRTVRDKKRRLKIWKVEQDIPVTLWPTTDSMKTALSALVDSQNTLLSERHFCHKMITKHNILN